MKEKSKITRKPRVDRSMSAPKIIVVVFLAIILAGALLLMLPISTRSGEGCSFLTAVFTATSATCVTGLSLVETYTFWSGFGQAVILILIQIGGLGFMTIVSVFFFVLRAKMGLRSRMLLSQSFGLDGVDGVVRMVRHVLVGTFVIEGIGILVLTIRFSMDQPFHTALWWGVFHSVSAFCNAGFDIMGLISPGTSLAPYAHDVTTNVTIMLLIIIGGLGFVVWEDIWRCWHGSRMTIYSKLVLLITGCLIFGGALLFLLIEWNNPATLGNLPTGQKILYSSFQSVTARTAGFASFNQGGLTDSGKAVTMLLMLIGGSSGSTAGGVKTVTMGIALMGAWATLRGKNRVTVFKRTVDSHQITIAYSILLMMVALPLFGAVYISSTCNIGFMDAIYETISAIATVGLSTGVTTLLNTAARWMIIAFMFFGRIGIMTIGIGFLLGDGEDGRYHYASTKMLIG